MPLEKSLTMNMNNLSLVKLLLDKLLERYIFFIDLNELVWIMIS